MKTLVFACWLTILPCLAQQINVFAEVNKDIKVETEDGSTKNVEISMMSNTISINGRKYNFFSEEVFNAYFLKSDSKAQYLFEKSNPILSAYILLIYPASLWLDNESLHILEIL